MQPSEGAWPAGDEGRNVLLFAQLLREMVAERTFESFRVYSLGTVSRLDEAIALIEDVQRNRLPREALEPVVQEMLWSFDKDPIAGLSAGLEIAALSELVQQQKPRLSDLAANIKLIKRLLSWGYKTALEQRIIDLFDTPRRRIELRQACGFYCSHLINVGFSKLWIQELVEEAFFTEDMSTANRTTLAQFFRKFVENPADFVVFTSIGYELSRLLPSLGLRVVAPKDVDQSVRAALESSGEELAHVAISEERAYDPYGAINAVHERLTSIRAFTYLRRETIACDWEELMYVRGADVKVGRAIRTSGFNFERLTKATPTRATITSQRKYILRVRQNFDPPSMERLLSSINTAALARTSPNRENQLISLWSAVEVLLSEPPTNTARIVSYVHQLVPAICLRHVRRQFVAVFEELRLLYPQAFTNILRGEDEFASHDPHTNFAAVICLEENELLREELCALLEENPLALHRLFKLYRDYGSSGEAAKAIKSHRNRVEWQVHRIYRARNQLVHSGRVPSYLDSLILNLAEYYGAAVATIIDRARREPSRSDIDQIVSEIGIEYGIFTRQFKATEAPLQRADLERLVAVP